MTVSKNRVWVGRQTKWTIGPGYEHTCTGAWRYHPSSIAEPIAASIRASILDSILESYVDTADCTIDWRPDAPCGDMLTTVVVVVLLVDDEPRGVTVIVAVVEGPDRSW